MMSSARLRSFLIFAATSFLCAEFSLFAETITIINRTGADIEFIQFAEAGNDSWGDDLIPNQVVLEGESVVLNLAGQPPFAMRLVDSSSAVYVLYDVAPGLTGMIVVGPEHRAELSQFAGSQRNIGITNNTGRTVTSLRISSVNEGKWGEDILSGRYIRNGERVDFLLDTTPGVLNFDIRFTLLMGNREIAFEKEAVMLTDGASLILNVQ